MRTSRKEVEAAFELFVKSIGGKVATGYNDVGAYRLDYNNVYGGYNIEQIHTQSGGVTNPFGANRRTASEMFDTLHFGRYTAETMKAKVA